MIVSKPKLTLFMAILEGDLEHVLSHEDRLMEILRDLLKFWPAED